jgi:hypothetical protein
MTFVGHSLTGLSVGVLCMPRRWRWPGRALLLGVFAFLAWLPDLKWTPSRLVRHSVFVNVALMAAPVAVLSLWAGLRRRVGGWPVVLGGVGAWLSHLLLDTLYSHGEGDRLLWPVSRWRLRLPLPWFDVASGGLPTATYLRIFGVEALCYGAVLAACVLIRRRRRVADPAAPVMR